MDREEFKTDLQIDPESLDVAAVTQADVFFKYASAMVDAKVAFDLSKKRLDVTEASIAHRIRKRAVSNGEKITEAAIVEKMKLQREYKTAQKAFLQARRKSLLCEYMVTAMEQRKRMIEVLVTLHGQQYFAGPSSPRDLVSAWKDYKNDRTEELTKRQRRKARRSGDVQ